jgi:hypothetical protein
VKFTRIATLGILIASTALAGCSDIYYDRRETVAPGAADAVASNMAVQTVDPWPRNVADQNISMNGSRAELAIQRYRTGRVISPSGAGTSSSGYQQQQPVPPTAAGGAPTSSAGTPVP